TPSAVSLSAPAFDNPECNMSAPVAMRPGIWCRRARILMVPLRRSTVRRYARAARGRPEPARPPTPAWRVNPPRTGRGGAPGGVRADVRTWGRARGGRGSRGFSGDRRHGRRPHGSVQVDHPYEDEEEQEPGGAVLEVLALAQRLHLSLPLGDALLQRLAVKHSLLLVPPGHRSGAPVPIARYTGLSVSASRLGPARP